MDRPNPESREPTPGPPANDEAESGARAEPEDVEMIDAREAERIRRRDREAEAEARALLRPGMGKVFKQIQDTQVRRGREASKRPKA